MASIAEGHHDERLSIGRVFQGAFAAIKLNPGVITLLALVIGAVPGLLMTLMFYSSGMLNPAAVANGTISMSAFYGATLVSSLTGLVISSLVQAALTRATVSADEGVKVGIGDSLAAALRVVVPLVGLIVLWALGVGLGFLLLIVPGIILMTMWAVAVPSLVVERVGIIGAFRRSAELTKGSRWKIFGLLLVLAVVYWLLAMVVNLVGLSTMSAASAGQLTLTSMIGSALIGTLFNMAWGTVQPSLYVELRRAKDGGSTESLADIFS